jgi:hypothetical protein
MNTLPTLGTMNPRLSTALKQLSAAKYGRPRAAVGAEITKRMQVAPSPATTPQNEPSGVSAAGVANGGAAPAAQGSFLDEWLAKRQDKGLTRSASPAPGAPHNPEPIADTPATKTSSEPTTAPPLAEIKKDSTQNRLPDSPTKKAKDEPKKEAFKTTKPNLPKETDSTKNISSDELERGEVHKIAEELKGQLDSPEHIAEEKIRHMKVEAKPVEEAPSPEDTIYIDREGNLRGSDNASKQSAEVKIDNTGSDKK